jgi:hypothetical protein
LREAKRRNSPGLREWFGVLAVTPYKVAPRIRFGRGNG